MNIFFPGWRFRNTAPIHPPEPDHTVKHRIHDLYKEASHQRRIALAGSTEPPQARAARAQSDALIKEITEVAVSAGSVYRDQVRAFEDRAATTNAGVNLLFLDPDNALQDPRVEPPAGVNHSGRHAAFSWSADAVRELVRIHDHTHAHIVLTSKWRNRATMRTNLNRELKARGLPPLVGRTNVLDGKGRRPAEVLEFLDAYVDGGSTKGAAVHGWCVLDDYDFTRSPDAGRFSGHFVATDPKVFDWGTVHKQRKERAAEEASGAKAYQAGLTAQVADRVIEAIRGRRLDAPRRNFVVAPFQDAPGLAYSVDPKMNRPGKSSVYAAAFSDSDSDEDDDDSDEDDD